MTEWRSDWSGSGPVPAKNRTSSNRQGLNIGRPEKGRPTRQLAKNRELSAKKPLDTPKGSGKKANRKNAN